MKTLFLLPLLLLSLLSPAWARPFQPKIDLRRCLVGNQAGLLKVLTPDRKTAYTRGIDDRSLASMTETDRTALLTALGIDRSNLGSAATQIMRDYAHLPRKEAIAVLATIAGSPEIDRAILDKLQPFLVNIMLKNPDVQARRQAILALAILPEVTSQTMTYVVEHFEKCRNLWETFPIQQFFEYHAGSIRQAANYAQLRVRVAAVQSLYTPSVLSYLDR